MAVTVELQIFSGRRDPIWTLTTAQVETLTSMIDAVDEMTLLKPPGVAGLLGYRGFLITADGAHARERAVAPEASLFVHGGVVDQRRHALNLVDTDNRIERWLLGSGGDSIDRELRAHVERLIRFVPPPPAPHGTPRMRRPLHRRRHHIGGGSTPTPVVPCRPQYDPIPWNAPANIGPNHCYNYAADKMSGSAALPGEGSGHECCQSDAGTTCRHVSEAAVRDLFVQTTNTGPTAPNQYLVALAVQHVGTEGRDFHWYRRDCDGFWSHKVGNSAARDWDESLQPIVDPATCDRGTYTEFCGYFLCDPSVVLVP